MDSIRNNLIYQGIICMEMDDHLAEILADQMAEENKYDGHNWDPPNLAG